MIAARADYLAQRPLIDEWLAGWRNRPADVVRGKCDSAAKMGHYHFPCLRIVAGMATDARVTERVRGLTVHAWLVAPTGREIDPTAHQYEGMSAMMEGIYCPVRYVKRRPFVVTTTWPDEWPERCASCRQPRLAGICLCGRTQPEYYAALIGAPPHAPTVGEGG